jgi:hypothetical protein
MTQSKPSETMINLDELDITLDLSSSGTITIDTTTMNDYAYISTSDTIDTIDISSIITDVNSDIDIDWDKIGNITFDRVMFEDDMPDPQEIKRMCEEYPALNKVYENFKTVYKMVEQDWRGKQDDDNEQLSF